MCVYHITSTVHIQVQLTNTISACVTMCNKYQLCHERQWKIDIIIKVTKCCMKSTATLKYVCCKVRMLTIVFLTNVY